jgi:dGTPase
MSQSKINWEPLLNQGRRKKETQDATSSKPQSPNENIEFRTEIERDYDRILFSTPVRRLADKTQVFPLDKNDSIRTRLTHSHEVSNLARSIGTTLAFNKNVAQSVKDSQRNIPALLAATGLVHDLGNPPFGHQGESAIQSWFAENEGFVLSPLTLKQHREDFLKFEGNAQGFRLVTRLQLINDDFGLDLTHATLAAMMKYPAPSDQTSPDHVATKKHGYFAAEQHVVNYVQAATDLAIGRRHPLAYIMEACDDIAYVVLDAEDAVKKGLASFSDLIAFLKNQTANDELSSEVIEGSMKKHAEYQKTLDLSPAEMNDVSMQRFRVFAIGAMIKAVTGAFMQHESEFATGEVKKSLLKISRAEALRKALAQFSYKHAYINKAVLEIELQGHNVIRGLMEFFWAGIRDRSEENALGSTRNQPFTRFVYSRISENYRRIFENPSSTDQTLPLRYRECLLLTDMVSGMTDSFAVNLYHELLKLKGEFDTKIFLREQHNGITAAPAK